MKHLVIAVGLAVTLSAATGFSGVTSRSVFSGGTLSVSRQSHAYSHYRFVIKRIGDKVPWESDGSSELGSHKWIRIRELALYDADGNLLSQGLSKTSEEVVSMSYGTCRLSGRIGDADTPVGNLFDGETPEISCWCNPNPLATYDWTWGYVYLRLSQNSPAVAAYNIAMPAAEYEPAAWSFEGSDDGANWTVLDEYGEAESLAYRQSRSDWGWYNGGNPLTLWNGAADPKRSHFFVERGGKLAIGKDAQFAGVTTTGGELEIADGVNATFEASSDETKQLIGGGLAGTGTFEKSGAGVLTVSGINSDFAGKVKVSGGTLRFASVCALPHYEFYRFIAKDKPADEKLELNDVAVYDVAGNRINGGASFVAYATATNPSGTLASMDYGKCTRDGQSTMWNSDTGIYDGNLDTCWYGWVQKSGAEWAWLYFYSRPQKTAAVPVSYNVASSPDNLYNPLTWSLQGSCDGVYWATLDEVDATRRAEIFPTTAKTWCNGGVPMAFSGAGVERANGATGEIDAKYFRFKVKAWGTGGSGGTRAIAELALYSIDGRRVNLGLVNKGREVASLDPGSFTFHNKSWSPSYNNDSTHEEKMFDNDLTTRLSGWSYGECETDYDCPSWTMRLKDDMPPVASYNFAPYSPNNANTYPVAWTLEASKDGLNWVVVDSRTTADSVVLLPPTSVTTAAWCNGGYPVGFTQNCERGLVPAGATLEVAKGARLEFPAAGVKEFSSLAVDLAQEGSGVGTIANAKFAATGALYLTHTRRCPRLASVELPLAFENVQGVENLPGWKIYMNGVEVDCYRLSVSGGKVFVDGGRGFIVVIQ